MSALGTPARTRIAAHAACYVVVLALLVCGWMEQEPYDDSYFFKRFARNFLTQGVLAWNAEDGPVYGSTSQLFQLLQIAVTALAPDTTVFATRILLALCLTLGYAGAFALSDGSDGGVAATLAFGSPVALYTALTGMETALVFALLVALLALLYGERAHRLHWSVAPLAVVAIWLARPDAVVLALPLLIAERWARDRRLPWRELLLVGGAVLALLCFFRLYYGTALPLPFYAKQRLLSPYDDEFQRISASVKTLRFGLFLSTTAPLVLVAFLRRDFTNSVLLGSVILFELYHVATTIEVMGMQGRFYAPALPLLAFAAARAVRTSPRTRPGFRGLLLAYCAAFATFVLLGFVATPSGGGAEAVPLLFHASGALGAVLLFAAPASADVRRRAPGVLLAVTAVVVAMSWVPKLRAPPQDDEYLDLHTERVTVFRGMDTLRACFGDEIHVYHSEIGVPGLRFERGSVSDLAGLMSPEWLFGKTSFDESCSADRPEAIFLPHRNYVALNRTVRESRCLQGYTRVVRDSSSPLYVRRDLTAAYRACRSRDGTQP